jgi:hypothetical protein
MPLRRRHRLGLVVESHARFEADALGIAAQQQLTARETRVMLVGVAVSPLPAGEDLFHLVEPTDVLEMHSSEIVVLYGTGEQCGECVCAITAKRKRLQLLEIHILDGNPTPEVVWAPMSLSPRMFLVVCLGLAIASPSVADARKHKKSHHHSKKKHKKHGVVVKTANMPPGWSWPPSRAMKTEGDACKEKLTELGVKWKKGPKTRKIATPIVLEDMTLGGVKVESWWREGPHVMDCHLAVGLETFNKGLYALGVREIKFSSIYRYDKVTVYGHEKNILSRHALGLAMDIHSMTDEAGNEAVVKDDYKKGNELLLNVEQYLNDSGGFRTVLTPRNDPESHDDHFHVEVKVDYTVPSKKPTS